MFVVMSATATPAEANAVKSLILAEGLSRTTTSASSAS